LGTYILHGALLSQIMEMRYTLTHSSTCARYMHSRLVNSDSSSNLEIAQCREMIVRVVHEQGHNGEKERASTCEK
jgi:gamma-glutamyl-gamma-aminobutyrate hydrolase PuuD